MSVTGDGAPGGQRRSATDVAYDALKRQVLVCQLGPGAELREAMLATKLGVSRTPVREALNRLVHDGLVEVRPRQGYRVTDVTLAGVHEVFELRLVLEPTIVAMAAERYPSHDGVDPRAVACLASNTDSFEDEIAADHDLHVRLAELSGNRYMARSMRQLLAEMQRILYLSLAPADLGLRHQHDELCTAVTTGEVDLARRLVIDELEQTRQQVLDAIITRRPGVSLADAARPVAGIRALWNPNEDLAVQQGEPAVGFVTP